MIHPDNLIYPMSEEQFASFIYTDRYGNTGFEEAAVLVLLDKIQGRAGYEEKELFILKALYNHRASLLN